MKETRRMHFVPQTYLEHFADQRGKEYFVHALTKETGKIFSPNITNICVEMDLYSLEGSTQDERQMLEKMYSGLFESRYDNLYKLLTDAKKEMVTMEERYEIISFVVSMFYRNNVWGNTYNKVMDETYNKVYHLAKENKKDSFFFGEQEIPIAGKTLEELQSENKKRDRPMIALKAAQGIFQLTRLRVLNDVITVSKVPHELVTSDNPVTLATADKNRRPIPMDPNNTLSLPIDANHLLQLRPWGHELDRTMLGRTPETSILSTIISEINNQSQYRQPGKFLIGTESGIKTFQVDSDGELLKKRLRGKL